LYKISQIVEIRHGRTELETYVKNCLSDLKPDDYFNWIPTIKWKAIYTTNYDNSIQKSYDLLSKPPQSYISITYTSDLKNYDLRFQVPIFHLHGSLFSASKSQIIITENDYTKYKERRRMMFEQLKIDIATSIILYIGYSNDDPNWKTILTEISEEFYPSKVPNSYRIDPFTSDIEIEILKSRNIETIKCCFNEFVDISRTELDISFDQLKVKKYINKIPTNLQLIYEKYPAATLRLLSAWEYVNQAPYNDKSNIYEFLRGDRPNWALISNKVQFERDIEEDTYESLLDFATSMSNKPQISIILGSAGYGTTTLLMSLATQLINDRAGIVFFLKPSQEIREGDIEFVITLFKDEKIFFFVDNCAEYTYIINDIIHKYRSLKKSFMFVLGERTNEWKQTNTKLKGMVFPILPLSDGEIYRLLDCLRRNNELNKIENLDSELQFAAIKKNYNRELLVAIREATEGTSFDAIIEDEFRGIKSDRSKLLYLSVCCFYLHGAFIRDNLLANLMKMNIVDLFDKNIRDETEGVVIFECIDEAKGINVARSRHRIIATIVWERCGEVGVKEKLIQDSLKEINLNYKTDKDAFDLFIKADRFVDSLHSLDNKIRFYETACNKEPDSPYVKQHFARMLLRENKYILALDQINEAIRLNNDVIVLHHTKGHILSYMALNGDSIEINRKRLYQSEQSFCYALKINEKNDYCYQGLAQLYLGWAKIISDENEQLEYINKAEDIINKGLKVVKQRDSLWIESANIQEYLGNQPSRLKALQKAIDEHPGSIIARYLLGRAYRKQGEYLKALEILKPVIKDYPEEFRSVIEYAISLLYLTKPYKEAIAILNLSTLYGYSDSMFIAILGGIYLLDKQFSESERVFSDSKKRDFNGTELYKIFFRPPDPKDTKKKLRITGVVKKVKAGYSFIQTNEYPEFLCPGSNYGSIIMNEGLKISFELAFTPKGIIVDEPMLI